jgi:hypothetical protein
MGEKSCILAGVEMSVPEKKVSFFHRKKIVLPFW